MLGLGSAKEPEWGDRTAYDINVTWPRGVYRGGDISRSMAMIFAFAAVMAYIWAELNWMSFPMTGGIGIGASGYAGTLYLRAVALGACSMACGVIHLIKRRPHAPMLSARAANVEQHP